MPTTRPRVRRKKPPAAIPAPPAPRAPNGKWLPGFSGRQGVDPARARRELNADTIREMHAAFRVGGKKAIYKVMNQSPAIFLKLLVLLVPRELEVTHSGGVKGMSDEAIAQAIEAIEAMLARRSGEGAKVIEASPSLPQPGQEADPT
jgi:hypothetical protein